MAEKESLNVSDGRSGELSEIAALLRKIDAKLSMLLIILVGVPIIVLVIIAARSGS